MKTFEAYKQAGIEIATQLENGARGRIDDKLVLFRFKNFSFIRSLEGLDAVDKRTKLADISIEQFIAAIAFCAWAKNPELAPSDQEVQNAEIAVLSSSISAHRSELAAQLRQKEAGLNKTYHYGRPTKDEQLVATAKEQAKKAHDTFNAAYERLNELCGTDMLTEDQMFAAYEHQFAKTEPET